LDGAISRRPGSIERWEVPIEKLRRRCDPSQFVETSSADASPTPGFIGQERAVRAIEFGLSVDRPGYNIFVTGLTGTGKTTLVRTYLERVVADKTAAELGLPSLSDWCYVFDAADPDRPIALRLPAGEGQKLRSQMDGLVGALRSSLAQVLGSEEYQAQRKQVAEASEAKQRAIFDQVSRESLAAGFLFQVTQTGMMLIPARDGQPLSQEELAKISPDEREALIKRRSELSERVDATLDQVRALERQSAEEMAAIERRAAEFAISRPFNGLLSTWREPEVLRYVEEIRGYTLENLALFVGPPKPEQPPEGEVPRQASLRDPFLAYRVNVFVDRSRAKGPPVVIETNPNWGNLFGKIERRAFMGAYFSDHTMLKPGSLHHANGGYLVVGARELLANPAVWDAFKRAIRNREVRLEDPAEALGMFVPQGLRPQPVPLDVKVIVTGEDSVYHLLSRLDEDFWETFKVKADFDYQIDGSPEYVAAYAGFIRQICASERLRPFAPDGIARVVEEGSRMVADQGKLSGRFGFLKDLIIEADYWAGAAGSARVEASHVRRAAEERIYRSSLVAERIRDMIADGTIMVDLDGGVVGQVNGLAVYDLGDIAFGRPSRITARTFVGRAGIVNVEREAHLSGSTHDKGVLILTGYLGWSYAQERPLGLVASVAFEQSYDGVDGDSASSTELYAILSSISELPLDQSIAVTGSVNQLGQVQPIGGANEKIEGFYDVCHAVGLTGRQGVVIPRRNVRNLMLREDVVEAISRGEFHVYAVDSIDEGLEILTGLPAGERLADGTYPRDTVHHLVGERLRQLSEGLQKHGAEVIEARPTSS
jgi:predicted ATP-dependent protease